ncbi:MAG: OsmC family protein [Anaerolineales bacterium]|nr:OsmC family protein [Anaerolineales bacterium]
MDAVLNWRGKMTFEGAGPTGFAQRMDADESSGGDNSGARPLEMLALGLAGCTAMDVISILTKKRQTIKGFQINFHSERANEHPKVFTAATLEYVFHGENIDEAAVVRAIQLSAEKYCPAQAMLSKAFPIRLTYKIYDAETKALVKEGEWKTE